MEATLKLIDYSTGDEEGLFIVITNPQTDIQMYLEASSVRVMVS